MADEITIRWNAQKIVPAVVQHDDSGEVLMVSWMNAEALQKTQESGKAHFWDTRQKRLVDGSPGGSALYVEAVWVDDDADALLVTVKPGGPVCAAGQEGCFFRELPSRHPRSDEELPWDA